MRISFLTVALRAGEGRVRGGGRGGAQFDSDASLHDGVGSLVGPALPAIVADDLHHYSQNSATR